MRRISFRILRYSRSALVPVLRGRCAPRTIHPPVGDLRRSDNAISFDSACQHPNYLFLKISSTCESSASLHASPPYAARQRRPWIRRASSHDFSPGLQRRGPSSSPSETNSWHTNCIGGDIADPNGSIRSACRRLAGLVPPANAPHLLRRHAGRAPSTPGCPSQPRAPLSGFQGVRSVRDLGSGGSIARSCAPRSPPVAQRLQRSAKATGLEPTRSPPK